MRATDRPIVTWSHPVDELTEHLDQRTDPSRLASIDRLGLLDAPRDEVFDRASRIASRLLDTPVALVSIVTDTEQRFVGATGLAEPYDRTRRTPLSHSFCQYVVRDQQPLVVEDATQDPLVADNRAIEDLDVQAYLGVPFTDGDGRTLGSFCVIDDEPRHWTDADLATLEDLARFVRSEVLLREHLAQLELTARSREDALRAAAHDLRAALSGISGAAATLASDRATDPALRRELLAMIERQSARAGTLLDALLDRAEAAADRHEPLELSSPIRRAVTTAASAFDAFDRVRLELAPTAVVSSGSTIERIVLNLVRNALEHTDGPVEITCGRDDDRTVVTVADHGPGLPSWLLDGDLRDAALQGRSRGRGIGIFSATVLAQAIDGQLDVVSDAHGTSFHLLLPSDEGSRSVPPAWGTPTTLSAAS